MSKAGKRKQGEICRQIKRKERHSEAGKGGNIYLFLFAKPLASFAGVSPASVQLLPVASSHPFPHCCRLWQGKRLKEVATTSKTVVSQTALRCSIRDRVICLSQELTYAGSLG